MLKLFEFIPQLQVLSDVSSNLYLVTATVQSSCKFYLSPTCRLFEYALLHLFSLWESEAGEQGGCFGSTGFAGFLAGTFTSPGLKLSWFFGALPLLVLCPRQGGSHCTHQRLTSARLGLVELRTAGIWAFSGIWGSGRGFSACWNRCCPAMAQHHHDAAGSSGCGNSGGISIWVFASGGFSSQSYF